MATDVQYKVSPVDPTTLKHLSSDSETPWYIWIPGAIATITGTVYFFINLLNGGYQWLIFLGIWIVLIIALIFHRRKANIEHRRWVAQTDAETYSRQLNEILAKSEQIVNSILPHFETLTNKSIDAAKVDLSEKAISPFWDKIEGASKYLAFYKEAVEQLVLNGELYSKILVGKKHNFPMPFPIGANISISKTTFDEYHSTIYAAHKTDGFSNIWEHRKTQKILIAGFQTLEQAINNIKNEILSAINNLNHSIKSEFRELRNIQMEKIKNSQAAYEVLKNTLISMDTRLYYLEYNKKPTTPFSRPPFD